jgi:hypothetical protein
MRHLWMGSFVTQESAGYTHLRLSGSWNSPSHTAARARSIMALLFGLGGVVSVRCGCHCSRDGSQNCLSHRTHPGAADTVRFAPSTGALLQPRDRRLISFNHFPSRILASNRSAGLDTDLSDQGATPPLSAAWISNPRFPVFSVVLPHRHQRFQSLSDWNTTHLLSSHLMRIRRAFD